jgi:glutathione peroxidase
MTTIYDFHAKTIEGKDKSLDDFRGQVLLIVNTASACGFTPQYKALQDLFDSYKDRGFTVLGFPCNQFGQQEKGADAEIKQFCELNFGVTFPLFSKVDVKGSQAHPLFQYLTKEKSGFLGMDEIKWNFTKFLINAKGDVVKRYAPLTKPESLKADIESLLTR